MKYLNSFAKRIFVCASKMRNHTNNGYYNIIQEAGYCLDRY